MPKNVRLCQRLLAATNLNYRGKNNYGKGQRGSVFVTNYATIDNRFIEGRLKRCHDMQQNDTQQNDTQNVGTHQNDIIKSSTCQNDSNQSNTHKKTLNRMTLIEMTHEK
jgi:hypothetical protein